MKTQPGNDESRPIANATAASATSIMMSSTFGKDVGVRSGQYHTTAAIDSEAASIQSRRGLWASIGAYSIMGGDGSRMTRIPDSLHYRVTTFRLRDFFFGISATRSYA